MDETISRSSYFGVLVRLFVVLVLLRVRAIYKRLFRGRGHLREHRVSVVFLQILYRDSSADIGAYESRFQGGDSVIIGVYK